MKRLVLAIALLLPGAAFAETYNPMFGDKENQLMFTLGRGINSYALIHVPFDLNIFGYEAGSEFVPYTMLGFTYSQPNTFFRLAGRQSFHFMKTLGFAQKLNYDKTRSWDWPSYDTEALLLSQDVVFFSTCRWYMGPGIGFGVQGRQNERFGTKFMLGFKIFTGYRITDSFSAEIIMQHYSNGDTGDVDKNYSYNFWGVAAAWNF